MEDVKYQFLRHLYKRYPHSDTQITFGDLRKAWPKCPDWSTMRLYVGDELLHAGVSHYEDHRDAKISLTPAGIEWVQK